MLERLKTLIDRRRELNEVDRLTPQELDDVGLSHGELRAVVSAPAAVSARQMAMARRFGLTEADFNAHRHDYVKVVQACRHCSAVGDCRDFLADEGADVIWADFCPNRDVYSDLAADRARPDQAG